MNYIQQVHEFVKKIPHGKVTTYGSISQSLRKQSKKKISPRMVGWALHQNKSAEVPCHRVVNSTGRLAPNFAFDGWQEQHRRLSAEGVSFKDEMHVDLAKCLWQPLGV